MNVLRWPPLRRAVLLLLVAVWMGGLTSMLPRLADSDLLPNVVLGEPAAPANTDPDPANGSPPGPALPDSSATAQANAPAVCRYEEAKAIVEAFIEAQNRGDRQAVARFFGRKFKWYSATIPNGDHFVAHRADHALDYVVHRHAQGDRLVLRAFHVSDPSGAPPRDHVNFWYELDRIVDGRAVQRVGKGALDCEAREIFVWSM